MVCRECKGTGLKPDDIECPACWGTGIYKGFEQRPTMCGCCDGAGEYTDGEGNCRLCLPCLGSGVLPPPKVA